MKKLVYLLAGVALGCLIGRKEQLPFEPDQEELQQPEDEDLSDQPFHYKKQIHFAFKCDLCKGLYFWAGNEAGARLVIDDMRQYDAIHCPGCNEINDYDDHVRKVIDAD
ncbi:hypothetical protein ACTFSJ_27570 [Bacillus cereus group sp. MYBK12-2]|uniref:hypothetical protein n=1 Tax=Bacillus cereus group sp. MYBK12-2 TaxID=3450689 RepID=UPI0032F5AF04|nr:hypothetical protein [Bacillus pacificus]HDR7653564.1 hypothetical protein [Bacillus pacificus]